MTHDRAWEHLPDLLRSRDDPQLLAHVAGCHACQRQLFLLGRVDRLLQEARPQLTRTRRAINGLGSLSLLATLAAAAALALVFLWPRAQTSHAFVLRTADGRTVARAAIARTDESNLELSLVARGMTRAYGDQFVLWAKPRRAAATPVGPFMVDRTGSCVAHFNLPSSQLWIRLWVTPATSPLFVLATT